MVNPDPDRLRAASDHAEQIIETGLGTDNTKALAAVCQELKRLESVAEEARTEVIEPALDDQLAVDDEVNGLQRRRGQYKSVTDEKVALSMLQEADGEPTEALQIFPQPFIELVEDAGLDPSEIIETGEYTYYRRA